MPGLMEAVRILTCEPAFNLFCCAVLVKVYEENPAPPPPQRFRWKREDLHHTLGTTGFIEPPLPVRPQVLVCCALSD